MATKKAVGTPLDSKVADKLLDLLGSDNEFRRLFKKDPAAALTKVGHRGPPFTPPGLPPPPCSTVKRIAPKAEITAAREAIKEYLTSSTSLTNPHCFEAGKISSSLRRK